MSQFCELETEVARRFGREAERLQITDCVSRKVRTVISVWVSTFYIRVQSGVLAGLGGL